MALGLNRTIANSILDAMLRAVPFLGPNTGGSAGTTGTPTLFVQLHQGDPGVNGTANTVSGNLTRHTVNFSAAVNGVSTNSGAVSWISSENTQSPNVDYSHFTIWGASSGGTFVGSGLVTANIVTAGDVFTIAIGGMTVTFLCAA